MGGGARGADITIGLGAGTVTDDARGRIKGEGDGGEEVVLVASDNVSVTSTGILILAVMSNMEPVSHLSES